MCFNPRTPVGCDIKTGFLCRRIKSFNPRTPVGCDTTPPWATVGGVMFQSTHPRGVRRGFWLFLLIDILFQSTHPRGVRLRRVAFPPAAASFNPRTPVGCDWCRPPGSCRWRCFNPRTPVGCDQPAYRAGSGDRVSIHAPPWGATLVMFHFSRKDCFNPRTPVGCDTNRVTRTIKQFSFNPRTPVGCDVELERILYDGLVSIHAPPWGATAYSIKY